MNKLTSPVYTKKSWGSEILWSWTDNYTCKTIEIDPYKVNDLVVYENKEKSIIVISGILVIAMGPCCGDESNLDYSELKEGWTRYISPGVMHRYGATDKPVRLIEVSSPELDEAIIITPIEELNLGGKNGNSGRRSTNDG